MKLTKEIIKKYKNTPIDVDINHWEDYKAQYIKHECVDDGTELVSIKKSGIKGKSYYYNRGITKEKDVKSGSKKMIIYQNKKFKKLIKYGLLENKCFLRKNLVLKLQELNENLKKLKLEIVIMSGYRAPLLQIVAKEVFQKFHSKQKADLMFANAKTGPHCSGGGFDIELMDDKGNILETKFRDIKDSMGTIFPEELLQIKGEDISKSELKIIKNRRLLHYLMKSIGCTYHYYEYWHYGFGDLLSSYIKSKEKGTTVTATYSTVSYMKYVNNLKKLKKIKI